MYLPVKCNLLLEKKSDSIGMTELPMVFFFAYIYIFVGFDLIYVIGKVRLILS